MEITLRQIADAVWQTRTKTTDEERQRIYDRARMLRDKEIISSAQPASQGRTTTFNEVDTAVAVVALTASLNGDRPEKIATLASALRAELVRSGAPMCSASIHDIKAGRPVIARLDIRTHPWPSVDPTIGGLDVERLPRLEGTTQTDIWPVTEIVKPVLDLLARE